MQGGVPYLLHAPTPCCRDSVVMAENGAVVSRSMLAFTADAQPPSCCVMHARGALCAGKSYSPVILEGGNNGNS